MHPKMIHHRKKALLGTSFCVGPPHKAFRRFHPSEIMNSDQGKQFASYAEWTGVKRIGPRI